MKQNEKKLIEVGKNIKNTVQNKEAFTHYINNYINGISAILMRVELENALGIKSKVSINNKIQSNYILDILTKVENILKLNPNSEKYIDSNYRKGELNPEYVFTNFIDKYSK